MENQIINSLMANLMGCGKQAVPQGGPGVIADGQNEFFALFSEKMMNTIFGTVLPEPGNDICADTGSGEQKEPAAAELNAPSCDRTEVSLILSAIAVALEQPAALTPPEEEVSAAMDFLNKILDVLSGGDEVELVCRIDNGAGAEEQVVPEDIIVPAGVAVSGKDSTGMEDTAKSADEVGTGENRTGYNVVDNAAGNSLAGPLAVFLSALNKMARNDTDKAPPQTGRPNIPETRDMTNIPQSGLVNVPDAAKTADPGIGTFDLPQETIRKEAVEDPAIRVDVTKSAIDNTIINVSRCDLKKDPGTNMHEKKDAPDSLDVHITERTEPDRIIVRVAEKEEPDVRSDADDESHNENGIGLGANSRQDNENQKSEVRNAGRTDFSRIMVEKIEKIAEQYSGKSLGMDMTVKLKIDDNETILVGLRDDGTRVTVEVKTANENTMNLIQSQKEGLMKDLEQKHIMTTIHVDIDQDAQGRQQQDRRREKGQDDPDEGQGFGDFFEAMA